MVKLVGPYRVVEELGRGGMGIVFRGVHDRLEREVAIKQLAPELTSNPQFTERFFSEAKTQAQLQHPNIVTIYDLIEEGGEFYIVMEYFPGRGLDEIVAEHAGQRMTEERALGIFSQVLEALDSAHSVGVIHRDVKPSNVLLDESDRVKLMDFGIALLVGDKRLTQSSQSIGTPVYMSPEQILHPRNLDHRTDIYSAAVMLYEMLAGRPPFDAETEYEIKKLHIEAPPAEAVRGLVGANPATLQAMERALDKTPEKRFSSAREFLRSLPAGGEKTGPTPPVSAAPPRTTRLEERPVAPSERAAATPGPPPERARSSGAWLWGGVATLALVLAAGLWFLLSSPGEPGSRPAPPPAPDSSSSQSSTPRASASQPSTAGSSPSPVTQSPPTVRETPGLSPPPTPRVDPAEEARRQVEQERRIRQRLVEETRHEVLSATSTARRLLANGDYEQARETVKRALSQSAPYRSDLVDEVVALQLLEQKVTDEILSERTREQAEREKERLARQAWEGRVAEVESLIDEGKYPEAQQLAERLLGNDKLPTDVAQRARELRERAREELKNVWGQTEVEETNKVINPRRKQNERDDG